MAPLAPPLKPRKQRKRSKPKNPLTGALGRDKWHPQLIGAVPNYPTSQEAFDQRRAEQQARFLKQRAEGTLGTRQGVPDGWHNKKAEVEAHHETAWVEAQEAVKQMKELGILPEAITTDDQRGELAMTMATAFLLDKSLTIRDRQAALNTLAAYTKPKPAAKSEVKLSTAEDFLNGLMTKAQLHE